jgi:hypothetical protein
MQMSAVGGFLDEKRKPNLNIIYSSVLPKVDFFNLIVSKKAFSIWL